MRNHHQESDLRQSELPLFSGEQTSSAKVASPILRHFVGWKKPLLDLAAEHLAKDWDGGDTLDLSRYLVVVPTRNAGRLLREKLALIAAERSESAVTPPLVVTPDFLVSPSRLESESGDLPVAGFRCSLLIWASLLLRIKLAKYRHVFPIDPVERDLDWAIKTAKEFLNVRKLLTEAKLDFSEAATILVKHELEPDRWRELAALEKNAIKLTRELGFIDESLVRKRAANEAVLPPEIEKIQVVGIPNLFPLAEEALQHLANTFPIELVIPAPAEYADHFGPWGHPHASYWPTNELDIPHAASTIHQATHPTGQAEKVVDLIANHPEPAEYASIGIPDTEVAEPVAEFLAARGWRVHNPSGSPCLDTWNFLSTRSNPTVARRQIVFRFSPIVALSRFCPGLASRLAGGGRRP